MREIFTFLIECQECGKSLIEPDVPPSNWNKQYCGKACAAKHKDRTRASARMKERNSRQWGENNPNWRNGSTEIMRRLRKSAGHKPWRRKVLERDGYKCVACGSMENLHVDHIKPLKQYPELRTDVNNGRALCFSCHKLTLSYGRNLCA